ncbi:MAG: hypothetical protein LBD68_10620 [Zoogloeaceae bacterium]|nr:hypothetical protein [Zoogloeaceae bacterium]
MRKQSIKKQKIFPDSDRSDTKTEGNELENLLLHSPMTRAEACHFFGVSARTLSAWMQGRARMPLAALRLARARLGGNLSEAFGKPFDEVRITPTGLHLPGMKYPLTIAELRAAWLYIREAADARAQLALLRIEHRQLKAAADYYRDILKREATPDNFLLHFIQEDAHHGTGNI